MSRLLRPRTGESATPIEPTWEATEVPAPVGWQERSRLGPRQWTVRSRRWEPDAATREIPVVLIHGLGIASSMCVPLARRLGTDGVTAVPDLPGFGRSEKPRPTLEVPEQGEVLGQWLHREIGTPAVVVGVSIGSQIALSAAVHRPEAFAGVVLVSPTMDRDRRSWLKQLPRWQLEQATQSMGMRALQLRDYSRAGVPAVLRTARSAMNHRPEEDIERLSVPALICRGSRDPLIRDEWARGLAQRAGARLAHMPGAVHAMSYENPLELARVINGFVDSLDRGHRG